MGKEKKSRRTFSEAFKKAALERMAAGANVSELARELKIRRKLLYAWKSKQQNPGLARPRGRPRRQVPTPSGPPDPQQRVAELESLVAQLTLENRFFKGALQNIERLRRQESAAGKPASSPKSKR
jgi:transposase